MPLSGVSILIPHPAALSYHMAAKIVSRRVERRSPEKIVRILNLRDFYAKRNKILIVRSVGGLGDIFMHRMIFEDFKRIMPDAEIHFACPKIYHDALIDHPFIDKVLDSATVDKSDYIISYNTTTACGRYEMKMAPFSQGSTGPTSGLVIAASNFNITTCTFPSRLRRSPEARR
jgi:hypothetical protein